MYVILAAVSPASPRKRKGAEDDDGTPSKKKRASPKKMVSEEPGNDLGGSSLDLPADMDQFSTFHFRSTATFSTC